MNQKPANIFAECKRPGATFEDFAGTPQCWSHFAAEAEPKQAKHILRYAIMLPGRDSSFRAGLRPDSNRERLKVGPPAGHAFPT